MAPPEEIPETEICDLSTLYLPETKQFSSRPLDKRDYSVIIRDIICKFCIKTYVVTPHLNRFAETVQMGDHNLWFR